MLVAGGFPTTATAELLDVDDLAGWPAGPDMNTPRQEHSASLLKNGKVLVVGGVSLDTAETWDPSLNSWLPTSNGMAARRWRHTATVLVNGRVLVAGTIGSIAEGKTAELYDPPTDSWIPTGELVTNRYSHSATLLPCGEVLAAGGESSSGVILTKSERYNPRTGTWRPTSDLNTGRWAHTATLLKDGKVLVTGGWNGGTLASAEIYDPASETWTPTVGNMTQPRYHHQATLLPNGKVLISGGSFASTTAELFNPATGTFAGADGLDFGHDSGFSATLLPNGKVLVTGGSANPSRAELFDPVATALGTWTTTANLNPSRNYHAAVLLLDGRVMVTGGGAITTATTVFYDVGRGELPGWRPVLSATTDPLVPGAPLTASGSSFAGLGEGSSGLGYMQSATNYPLVQLRRLDNELVSWLPVDACGRLVDTSFRSLPVNGLRPRPGARHRLHERHPGRLEGRDRRVPAALVTGSPTSLSVCQGDAVSFTVSASRRLPDLPVVEGRRPDSRGRSLHGNAGDDARHHERPARRCGLVQGHGGTRLQQHRRGIGERLALRDRVALGRERLDLRPEQRLLDVPRRHREREPLRWRRHEPPVGLPHDVRRHGHRHPRRHVSDVRAQRDGLPRPRELLPRGEGDRGLRGRRALERDGLQRRRQPATRRRGPLLHGHLAQRGERARVDQPAGRRDGRHPVQRVQHDLRLPHQRRRTGRACRAARSEGWRTLASASCTRPS